MPTTTSDKGYEFPERLAPITTHFDLREGVLQDPSIFFSEKFYCLSTDIAVRRSYPRQVEEFVEAGEISVTSRRVEESLTHFYWPNLDRATQALNGLVFETTSCCHGQDERALIGGT